MPHLTSLYHFHRAGEYGDRSYPGNCGGNLIRDLLLYFQPQNIFDPMTGSGTCADVCRELSIPCLSQDIRREFYATDADCFRDLPKFDFIWAHPPYWRQKIYTPASRDLSAAPTLEMFLERYGAFIVNCAGVLSEGSKFVILMGDYCDREAGFVSLTYHTKQLALAAGLRQYCTDIIRFSTARPAAAKPTGAVSFQDCMTRAWCSRSHNENGRPVKAARSVFGIADHSIHVHIRPVPFRLFGR